MTEGHESTNQHIIYKHDTAKNLVQQHLKLLFNSVKPGPHPYYVLPQFLQVP